MTLQPVETGDVRLLYEACVVPPGRRRRHLVSRAAQARSARPRYPDDAFTDSSSFRLELSTRGERHILETVPLARIVGSGNARECPRRTCDCP